jgi:hypothetical protein
MPYARARGRISSRCFSADVVGRNRRCLDAEPSFFLAAPDRLRSTATARGTVSEAMLYAFDLLELDGEDLQARPLGGRKKRLARLLDGRRLGIVLSDHTDEDGATIFRQACVMGLEGIVSKRLTAPYRSGPSRDWIKDQEPGQPSDDPGAGSGMVTRWAAEALTLAPCAASSGAAFTKVFCNRPKTRDACRNRLRGAHSSLGQPQVFRDF